MVFMIASFGVWAGIIICCSGRFLTLLRSCRVSI